MAEAERPETILAPAPTAWPITLALGVTLLAGGLVMHFAVSVLGAVLILAGAAGWFRVALPEEREVAMPLEAPPPPILARPSSTRPAVAEHQHRARLPIETYPISAGIKGGIAGGVAMAILAMIYGLVSHHSLWYPINLLAAGVYYPALAATSAQLDAFSALGLGMAIIIHGLASLLVGLLYGALLPIVPKRPILFGGVVAPVAWTALLHPTIGIINPVLAARIGWGWFIASQIGFGLVAGLVVLRSRQIRTPQAPHVAAQIDRLKRTES